MAQQMSDTLAAGEQTAAVALFLQADLLSLLLLQMPRTGAYIMVRLAPGSSCNLTGAAEAAVVAAAGVAPEGTGAVDSGVDAAAAVARGSSHVCVASMMAQEGEQGAGQGQGQGKGCLQVAESKSVGQHTRGATPRQAAIASFIPACLPACLPVCMPASFTAAAPRDVFAPSQPQGQYKFKALVMQLQVRTRVYPGDPESGCCV